MKYPFLHSEEMKVGESLWTCHIEQKILPWEMSNHMYRDSMTVDERVRI